MNGLEDDFEQFVTDKGEFFSQINADFNAAQMIADSNTSAPISVYSISVDQREQFFFADARRF